ncbi:hypothetical protein C8J56DRAFT_1064967 [Mycena floridula]|nr:hypothetical protein C8J56DRAFT_1064967 [Mycena floridula]
MRPTHKKQSMSYPSTSYIIPTEDILPRNPVMSSGSRSIMSSVRRSLSAGPTKRRQLEPLTRGMYSTPEESNPYPSRFRSPPSSPPTVEQIAMGLHISKTPQFRRQPFKLPPPPVRSSLKKPNTATNPGLSTASSTTVNSTAPSTPHSSSSILTKVSRFLPGTRSSRPSSLPISPATSIQESKPKKAVRFMTPPRD